MSDQNPNQERRNRKSPVIMIVDTGNCQENGYLDKPTHYTNRLFFNESGLKFEAFGNRWDAMVFKDKSMFATATSRSTGNPGFIKIQEGQKTAEICRAALHELALFQLILKVCL